MKKRLEKKLRKRIYIKSYEKHNSVIFSLFMLIRMPFISDFPQLTAKGIGLTPKSFARFLELKDKGRDILTEQMNIALTKDATSWVST